MVAPHVPRHGIAHPLEVVETVLEVADVAWNAYEHHRERRHQETTPDKESREENRGDEEEEEEEEGELSELRSENNRLRAILAENLALLQSISKCPELSEDCPHDLYPRLQAAVESSSFLTQLEAHDQTSTVPTHDCFPFKEVQGEDLKSVDILVYDDHGEPSRWVRVTGGTDSGNLEELCGLDKENYVIICEEDVVDAIAKFIAKCILANPKSKRLSPEELQKTVSKALGGMKDWNKLRSVWHAGKLIYALSTWGIALSALYSNRFIVKAAAKGIYLSGKFIMKAL